MKKLIVTALTLVITASALAQKPPVRRTVVVRDGKVITDETHPTLVDNVLLGGPRAYLGVSLNNLSPELNEHFGGGKEAAVIVESVADDSPAARAGVRVGDVIVSLDGKDVKNATDVRAALREKKEGDPVRIEVQRGRSRQTVVATVKERAAPRLLQLDELPGIVGTPEFRARLERIGDCGDLQGRIKELETRLKDLEKKLQK
ncbi:MAG TPA: PDZ domain-containing protein [Thermoanaerobaculia bacterium]|jgi:membrane-associated protease RseP (regulator of RpoE activity)